MDANQLTSSNSVDDDSTYQSDAFDATAGTLLLAFVTNARTGFDGTPTQPGVTSNGLRWQLVTTVLGGAAKELRLSCFRAMPANSGREQLTIGFGDTKQDLCMWSVVEITGAESTGANGANAVAQSVVNAGKGTTIDVRLAASAQPDAALTIGAAILAVDGFDLPQTVEPGAGFTELDEQAADQPFGKRTVMQTQVSNTNPGTATWSWTRADDAAAIAIEIKAPGPVAPLPTDPIQALISRFEPVLFLHEDEKFLPSDAKRFIENAALWGAKSPFTDKAGWGVKVAAGQLVAKQSEVGGSTKFLGAPDNLVDTATDVRFLELGGWKDKGGAHEASTAAPATNPYADRADIERLYRGPLEPSTLWYHAEVYDSTRLTRLASKVVAPNLSRIVAEFDHPTLLCYYFFFPAHEQSVGSATCPNVEAAEAYCHAGDWQCVAILLEGTGSTDALDFSPRYFGYTGGRPQPKDGAAAPAFSGDDDLGGYTVMKVVPWRAGSPTVRNEPDLDGDHPRLYVANGTHSLYTNNGTYDVAPEANTSLAPSECGTRDDSSTIPGSPGGKQWSVWKHLANLGIKISLTSLLGFGWVGLVWGVVQSIQNGLQPFGLEASTPSGTPPSPETTPPAGEAITLRPAGLTVAGSGVDVRDWRVQQGLDVNGRTYDFVVDRTAQIYWPSDDLTQGFRGRWGQQVSDDAYDRRNGPHFLQFWKMFLTALAGVPRP